MRRLTADPPPENYYEVNARPEKGLLNDPLGNVLLGALPMVAFRLQLGAALGAATVAYGEDIVIDVGLETVTHSLEQLDKWSRSLAPSEEIKRSRRDYGYRATRSDFERESWREEWLEYTGQDVTWQA